MSSNPYEAPQTTPPPDPLRAYRWVGNFFLVMSVLFGLMSVMAFIPFFMLLGAPRPRHTSSSFFVPALGCFGIVAGLFFTGRYFRRKGRRPLE